MGDDIHNVKQDQWLANDHFEPEFTREFDEKFIKTHFDTYFRPVLFGAEKLPKEAPFLLAANHSGNAFPYDATMLDILLWRRDNYNPDLKIRSTALRALMARWWCRPYGIDDFWRRCGCVDMTFDNFEKLLAGGYRTAYYPEGAAGIGKGFNKRYQLQRYSSSFVTLAARYNRPVYPVYIINAEWSVPFIYTYKTLNRISKFLFRLPFVPVPAVFTAILFPWIFYLSGPAKLVYVIGDPIDMRTLLREEGEEDFQQGDIEKARAVAERVRQMMQEKLTKLVSVYGKKPWNVKELFATLKKERKSLIGVSPLKWPFGFLQFHRDHKRPPAANRFTALLRDWDIWLYFVPFSWPLLSLARAFRKPPCGYRGLSRRGRKLLQGEYTWQFDVAPRWPKSPGFEEEPAPKVEPKVPERSAVRHIA